jgi:putative ubiquitin-RnfH superfamily antitoxin RatB of RatAB toxin-antitoxin module
MNELTDNEPLDNNLIENELINNELIEIEVVYGLPHKQVLLSLKVPKGTSMLNCIKLSGIVKHFPEIIPEEAVIGIFSKLCKLEDVIHQGDRIEIYRPLTADPKEMRKLRAEKAKQAAKQ